MSTTDLACFGGEPILHPSDFIAGPIFTETDALTAADLVRSGAIEPIHGKHNLALREEWAAAVGARHCLTVHSGMSALQAALFAAGVRPGHDALVPALTFTATASAVTRLGARPIFVDTTPDTFELDLRDAEAKLTADTTAIVPVHVHGLPADMPAIARFADDHGLSVIEDAAQAPGATLDGRHVGAWGTATIYSHSKGKPVMAGGGGELTTDHDDVFERALLFANQGEHRPPVRPDQHRGYECLITPCDRLTMAEFTAALIRGQLAKLPQLLATARSNAAILLAGLAPLTGVVPPHVPAARHSSWTYFRFRVDPQALPWDRTPTHARDNVIWALWAEGVPVTTWLLRGLDRLRGFRALPHGSLRPVDPAWAPVTQRTLDSTAVLGVAPHMLQYQTAPIMRRVVDAFEKVFAPKAISRVLRTDHHPLVVVPAPSDD